MVFGTEITKVWVEEPGIGTLVCRVVANISTGAQLGTFPIPHVI